MTEYFSKFIAIICGIFITFILPSFFLITHKEAIAKDYIKAKSVEFIDKGRVLGKIDEDSISEYLSSVYSLGEYDIEIDHYSKKAYPKYNEDFSSFFGYTYESTLYTLDEILDKVADENEYPMKNGDFLTVRVTINPSKLYSSKLKDMLGLSEVNKKTIVEYGAEVEHD